MIVKRKGKFIVMSKKTKRNLGTYPFKNKKEEEEAERKAKKRLKQIEFFKRVGK
jgi:hypothetical protein